uniref:ATP-dependent RNA helicase SUV3 homolog, mitochondrial n=1 Tax=Strigamia maritima TaxID=126957 RepID=T1JH79_STRMM
MAVEISRRNRNCRSDLVRHKSSKTDDPLFVPVPFKIANNSDDINVGEELSSKLQIDAVKKLLSDFYNRLQVKLLAEENGLHGQLYKEACNSFTRFCVSSETLPPDLHITFTDVIVGAGHVDDIYPYFMRHAKEIYPHLQCMDDLKKISDLRLPANWYSEARSMDRKIIFHCGPTNSGKTYHALERFINAKSGIYCGPLKLLAVEVHDKTNKRGTKCDLITGEERQYANKENEPSDHVACTVEMTSVKKECEVAVVDEIQMIKDPQRGWAWTRALLGIPASEIHLCGEEAAIGVVKEICEQIGETVEVRKYKRLTGLTILDESLESLENVEPGDCIVCFNKSDIYTVSRTLEKIGHQCAVIYGGLPPGTKLAQAQKFNDVNNPCKILVATDAIGMGLNLSIKRIIFYSLIKPHTNEKGEKEMDTLSTSQALQIAGRAGRFGTQFSEGFATTYKRDDLKILKEILKRPVEPIKVAGLHPTADQIELFAYQLPQSTLSNLIDIFVNLCEVDNSRFFVCDMQSFKFVADMIQHISLALRARYVFCCSPIDKRMSFVCSVFLKFVRKYSINEVLTFDWLCRVIGWPVPPLKKISDLVRLEQIFDTLDLYLWLSYRFPDLFPDGEMVRSIQQELDAIIQVGVVEMATLLKNSETSYSHGIHDTCDDDDTFKNQNGLITAQLARNTMRQGKNREVSSKIGRGRLADRLISKGLLSTDQLEELQREWKNYGMQEAEMETKNK